MQTRLQTKKELFKILSNFNNKTYTSRVVCVDEFINKYEILKLGNGGSWCRKSNWINEKVATLKNNGIINYLWDYDDDDETIVKNTFSKCKISNKGNDIRYISIFGKKNNNINRNIRKDIKDYYKNKPCVNCGSLNDLVCDHKNDLYNNPRVLNIKTQELDDFQSLCNHCNLLKRQICKDTIKTGKRYSAKNIPHLSIFNIDFINGDFNFDKNDINAMVGTYWYDPIEFMKHICKKLK